MNYLYSEYIGKGLTLFASQIIIILLLLRIHNNNKIDPIQIQERSKTDPMQIMNELFLWKSTCKWLGTLYMISYIIIKSPLCWKRRIIGVFTSKEIIT
jgi:hypothetical protein